MKTNLINSISLIMLIFSVTAISKEKRQKDIVEFTKFSDKQDLYKIFAQLQNEKLILQSTISDHGIKCQSVLDSCKNKFSKKGCELTHNLVKQEIEETIKVTEQSMKENKEIMSDINNLIEHVHKDCNEIESFYHTAKIKLGKDNKSVRIIKKKIQKKLTTMQKEEQERKKKEKLKAKENNITVTTNNMTNASLPKSISKRVPVVNRTANNSVNVSQNVTPTSKKYRYWQ